MYVEILDKQSPWYGQRLRVRERLTSGDVQVIAGHMLFVWLTVGEFRHV